MKLELKHLAPYLPYGLKYKKENNDVDIFELIGLSERNRNTKGEWRTYNRHQFSSNPIDAIPIIPILRPLSDLTNKNMPFTVGFKDFPKENIKLIIENPLIHNYFIIQSLLKYHFDVFGLIEKGLAIDINTI